MAISTQGFRIIATHNYRGTQIDLLSGHIHEFKATFIAVPISTNQKAFPTGFSATKIRANKFLNLSPLQRVFEAAGDQDGTGALSQAVKSATPGKTPSERVSRVAVTGPFGLAPGVKGIIHVYHPEFMSADAATDEEYRELRTAYFNTFSRAFSEDIFCVPDTTIALSPLSTSMPDYRSPQACPISLPEGAKIALDAILRFINRAVEFDNPERKPAQIAIILPPPEGDGVDGLRQDEAFRSRLQLEKHFAKGFLDIIKKAVAPGSPSTGIIVPDADLDFDGSVGPDDAAVDTAAGTKTKAQKYQEDKDRKAAKEKEIRGKANGARKRAELRGAEEIAEEQKELLYRGRFPQSVRRFGLETEEEREERLAYEAEENERLNEELFTNLENLRASTAQQKKEESEAAARLKAGTSTAADKKKAAQLVLVQKKYAEDQKKAEAAEKKRVEQLARELSLYAKEQKKANKDAATRSEGSEDEDDEIPPKQSAARETSRQKKIRENAEAKAAAAAEKRGDKGDRDNADGSGDRPRKRTRKG